jgi:two-component system, OmpR family, response regulator
MQRYLYQHMDVVAIDRSIIEGISRALARFPAAPVARRFRPTQETGTLLPSRYDTCSPRSCDFRASSNARAILVVDDEPRIRTLLRRALGTEGFSILEASTKEETLRTFRKAQVDLVTLDLNLGHTDGLQLAREMRAIRNVPLVMITGRGSQIDRIVGLENGADDYISKPFNLRETMLRIQCVLRRYDAPLAPSEGDAPSSGSRVRAFDHCVLDLVRRELQSTDGEFIDLTDTEFRLLALFVENPARVLSRDELTQIVLGREWSPLDRTLDGHVARLRCKLGGRADERRFIKSVRGVGYVFASDVSSR